MAFKDKLKELRTAKGLTQDEFSRVSGIGRSAISMYESGKREPDYITLTKLSILLGVSVDVLIDKEKLASGLLQSEEGTLFRRSMEEREKENDEQAGYYRDPKVAQRVDELKNKPGLRILFDASRDLSDEDIDFVVQFVERLKKKEK